MFHVLKICDIAFSSAPCHSLKITLGIALHCQHCIVIIIEHLTLQSIFACSAQYFHPSFLFLLRHIMILYAFKLLYTYELLFTIRL
jgi:hypothetical protein